MENKLYEDIAQRTQGDIYIGVVGPVRTGKSTFIKRFMETLVLPKIENAYIRDRARDELPQSGSGRVVMTAEPKFVPEDAVEMSMEDGGVFSVRLIDCVGYMVPSALGQMDGDQPRMVMTPWFDHEIPFTKAAAIGTRKVIHDHSTIGIVVTTDGSITDIPRENYREGTEKTIRELQSIGKPFVVLVNSKKPFGDEAKQVAQECEQQYGVSAIPVNCEQLKEEDITRIMEAVLYEFPVSEVQFFIPKWVEMLPREHKIKQELLVHIKDILNRFGEIRDAVAGIEMPECMYIEEMKVDHIEMDTGCVKVRIQVAEKFYYEMLSELTGTHIAGQYELVAAMKNLSELKKEYEGVRDAFASVRMRGYGVVSPQKEEITLEEPTIIKQGSKYGVKIHSEAPSIHLIRANIETEIAPIVGSEQQAQDLIRYIKDAKESEEGIWGTNIFGKSIEELVMDGMQNKMAMINDESQEKLQDTMQKIVNDSNGGLVCIII